MPEEDRGALARFCLNACAVCLPCVAVAVAFVGSIRAFRVPHAVGQSDMVAWCTPSGTGVANGEVS